MIYSESIKKKTFITIYFGKIVFSTKFISFKATQMANPNFYASLLVV